VGGTAEVKKEVVKPKRVLAGQTAQLYYILPHFSRIGGSTEVKKVQPGRRCQLWRRHGRRPFLLLAGVDLGSLIRCEATSGGPWFRRCEGGEGLIFLFWLGRTVACLVSDLRTGPGPWLVTNRDRNFYTQI
jgi:hypothetical protein